MRRFLGPVAAIAIAAAVPLAAAPSAEAHSPGGGYGYPGGGWGGGPMMGGGQAPGWGMAGPGYGHGWMMGPAWGRGRGYAPGWMMPGYGPPAAYGFGRGRADLDLSTDDVKDYLAGMIRNPRLKVGTVAKEDDDTIVADVVTKDRDVLVQRFEFNRHSGQYRPKETQ